MNANSKIVELSNERLVTLASSIGATHAHHKASDKYSFVSTLSAVNFLRDSGWIPVSTSQVKARGHKAGFQKHMIRFTRQDLMVGERRMDLILYNSHDLESCFHLIGGVFEFVCSNGMIVGDKMAEFRHRHIDFDPNLFIESAGNVGRHMEKVAGVIEDWKTIDLEKDERGIFVSAAHSIIFNEPEKAPIAPLTLLETRRYQDRNKTDLWATFNIVQENAIKGGLRGVNAKGKRTKTREVKSIDKDKKLNEALWILTEKMAEIKRKVG